MKARRPDTHTASVQLTNHMGDLGYYGDVRARIHGAAMDALEKARESAGSGTPRAIRVTVTIIENADE